MFAAQSRCKSMTGKKGLVRTRVLRWRRDGCGKRNCRGVESLGADDSDVNKLNGSRDLPNDLSSRQSTRVLYLN